jgi:hypothetical protein
MKKVLVIGLVLLLCSSYAMAGETIVRHDNVNQRVYSKEMNLETDTESPYYNQHVIYYYTDEEVTTEGGEIYGNLDHVDVVE